MTSERQTTEEQFEWCVICFFKVFMCVVRHGSSCDYYDRLPTTRNQIIFF
jgi:hypothetical protein